MRAPLPALAALLAALAGCGTGLYDADGLPPIDGAGRICDAGQVVCANVCTTEDASHCGSDCVECGLGAPPPANGQVACLDGTCGFECLDGLLKCGDACCPTTALAAGPAFTCARLDDGGLGAVRCWGANESGQLGDGTVVGRPTPVAVPLAGATAVGAGEHHACAILPGGAVRCWGANDAGQVGPTPVTPVLAPAATPVTAGAVAVVGGASHTCALVGDAVRCWGDNSHGQLGGTPDGTGAATPIASGATAIAAGAHHTCAVVGGAVRCWGANAAGQLGDGTSVDPGVGVIATPIASGIVGVAASADQTCATTGVSNNASLDDVVRCWGTGLGGAFGLGAPQVTPAIPLKQADQSTIRFDVALLAIGRAHACAGRTGEFLYCFGAANDLGQLGAANVPAGSSEAFPVTGNLVASALAVGGEHACAAVAGGQVRCWGADDQGQLGDGSTVTPAPGTVVAPSGR